MATSLLFWWCTTNQTLVAFCTDMWFMQERACMYHEILMEMRMLRSIVCPHICWSKNIDQIES